MTGDIISGYSTTAVLILAFAFVSMYRLGLYLTGSKICAGYAAIVFVTAPYLHVDRTLRGAYPEYFAFCLLPAVTYLNIRALCFKSYKYWAMAVLATSALMLSHLITAFYFMLFTALFIFFSWLSFFVSSRVRDRHQRKAFSSTFSGKVPKKRRTFLSKAMAATSVAIAALLLSMWCMGPVLFYEDLSMKREVLTGSFKVVESGYMVPLLGMLSIGDIPFAWREQFADFSRFQAGFMVLLSIISLARYRFPVKGVYARPFLGVCALIVLFVLVPSLFRLPILNRLDIAQFSFRFLAPLTLAGALAGALALSDFFRSFRGFDPALKAVTFVVLTALSLSFASPYIFPSSYPYSSVMKLGYSDISGPLGLEYGETAYLRPAPPENDPGWTDPDRRALTASGGKPGAVVFSSDLESYRLQNGGPAGELLLDVLYFPGLQSVDVEVDGIPVDPALDTWWQRRAVVRQDFTDAPGAFHGLKLTGVPVEGFLEARVRFTGMSWANRLSLASLILLALGVVLPTISRSGARRAHAGRSPASGGIPASNEIPPDGSA
jgi:hypothetical protein